MNPNFKLPAQLGSFSAYFELKARAEDVAAAWGYHLERQVLELPQSTGPLAWVPALQARLTDLLTLTDLTSEQARREVLIGPVLTEAALHLRARLEIEYPIEVADNLKGTLDYLLQTTHHLLVIEAKHADPTRGFMQLVAELIALDKWTDLPDATLYGAISLGSSWQFACLQREKKCLIQDVNSYALPRDLEIIAQTIVGVLQA
nr:hypothetical protein [Armatimonas sp.]